MTGGSATFDPSLFDWPIVGEAAEARVLALLRKPGLLDSETVSELEASFARWLDRRFALCQSSGTSALESALFACGVGPGAEVIGPSLAYWACVQPATRLGATIVLADVTAESLTLNVDQVEALLTSRTRAVVTVHAHGRVGELSRLAALCRRHGVALIEDASHAIGAAYEGKRAGAVSDISVFSMNGKVFAVGEGGMLTTDSEELFERAVAWGLPHHFDDRIRSPALKAFAGVAIGATTCRIGNVSAALALEQLGALDERISIIDAAMTRFADGVDRIPGLRVNRHRNTSMAGRMSAWHQPLAFYEPEAAAGVPLSRVVVKLRSAGLPSASLRPQRFALHLHPWYRAGNVATSLEPFKPSVRCPLPLPVSESIDALVLPRFTSLEPKAIERALSAIAAAVAAA